MSLNANAAFPVGNAEKAGKRCMPARVDIEAAADADLASVIECWPLLTEVERQQIVDDVRALAAAHAPAFRRKPR